MKKSLVSDNFLYLLQKDTLTRDKQVDLKKQEDLGVYGIE